MADDNNAFVPFSPAQSKKEYFDNPFWLSKFQPGSQFTIVEDHPRNKPMRYMIKKMKWGDAGKSLIRINDGFVSKDLELGKMDAQLLFAGLPDDVQNLKGCTFANDNGRWIFVAQTMPGQEENFPKSNQIAASMTEAPTTIASQIQALHAAINTNINTGIKNTPEKVLEIANKIKAGDGEHLIQAAKDAGWLVEVGGVIRGT